MWEGPEWSWEEEEYGVSPQVEEGGTVQPWASPLLCRAGR